MEKRIADPRAEEILALLSVQTAMRVDALSERLHASPATIRRDLARLEAAGRVRRTHGGVIGLSVQTGEVPLDVRLGDRRTEKAVIGKLAAELVSDGDTLFLDSSSTTLCMVRHLRRRSNLTVVTNGLRTAQELSRLGGVRVFCTGGQLREQALSFAGPVAVDGLSRFRATRCFLSCRTLDATLGLSDTDVEEADLRRAMIACSRETVVLADHTKLDRLSPFAIAGWNQVTCLASDRGLDPLWQAALDAQSVRVLHP